jgi:peptidoglycan/xylan/chitin deacetylase (PgdA/CDA1 family)
MARDPARDEERDARAGRWAAAGRRARAVNARPATVRFPRAVVSFTFDDFPKSAARQGAAIVESVGGHATFYAAAAFAGQSTQYGVMFDAEDLARLKAGGHEIGCHTFSHVDPTRAPLDDFFADLVRNADTLAAMGLDERLISFAYPYGATTAAVKRNLPARFTSARGAEPGVAQGRIDLAQLPANPLYGEEALARCLKLVEQARRRGGWLLFVAHDVAARPTLWGAQTGVLERVAMAAYAAGMEISTVRAVTARLIGESEKIA